MVDEETCAQDFVARDDCVKTLLQRTCVERPGQPQNAWDVVGSAVWLQLIEEPQTFLSKRKW